jgi:hypothetical protein
MYHGVQATAERCCLILRHAQILAAGVAEYDLNIIQAVVALNQVQYLSQALTRMVVIRVAHEGYGLIA